MKIRTDFVTNSSSYSTTEIIIDNHVLLEILQKYKDMGLFAEWDPIFGIGSYESTDPDFSIVGNERPPEYLPAFYYFESSSEEHNGLQLADSIIPWTCNPETNAPYSLEEVLDEIIDVMENGMDYLDPDFFPQLKAELLQRKTEITADFSLISWRQDCEGDYRSQFLYSYDRENGVTMEYVDENNDDNSCRFIVS